MQQMGKYLLIVGVVIAIAGAIIWLLGDKLHWFGNLPGDIRVERENFKFYFPITTMVIISVLISALLWVVRKLF